MDLLHSSAEELKTNMKLVVALDLPTPQENLDLLDALVYAKPVEDSDAEIPTMVRFDIWAKIGLNTFIAGGEDFIKQVKEKGYPVVLDLKLYDIPYQMGLATQRICELGVGMFTIHASAGEQGMFEVVKALCGVKEKPKILAVTTLTSFTHDHCKKVYNRGRGSNTQSLVKLAFESQVDGVVCSADDVALVNAWTVNDPERVNRAPREPLIKFVPGVRFEKTDDDQKATGGLRETIGGGADFIVVGRPIYKAENPAEMTEKILHKISVMENALETFQKEAVWDE